MNGLKQHFDNTQKQFEIMNIPKEVQHKFWIMVDKITAGANIIEELVNFYDNIDYPTQEKISIALENTFKGVIK